MENDEKLKFLRTKIIFTPFRLYTNTDYISCFLYTYNSHRSDILFYYWVVLTTMKYLDNQTILQTTFKNKYSTLSNPEGIDLCKIFQDHLLQRSIIQILQGPSQLFPKQFTQ
jgi:hypothetical protein